jgi:hypothetical protein
MYCEHLNYIEIRCLKVSIKQLLLRLFNQKVKKKKKMRKGVTHPIIRLDEHPTPIFPPEIKRNCEYL